MLSCCSGLAGLLHPAPQRHRATHTSTDFTPCKHQKHHPAAGYWEAGEGISNSICPRPPELCKTSTPALCCRTQGNTLALGPVCTISTDPSPMLEGHLGVYHASIPLTSEACSPQDEFWNGCNSSGSHPSQNGKAHGEPLLPLKPWHSLCDSIQHLRHLQDKTRASYNQKGI